MEAFIATFYHYSTGKMALAINKCLHICMYAQLYPSADFHEFNWAYCNTKINSVCYMWTPQSFALHGSYLMFSSPKTDP